MSIISNALSGSIAAQAALNAASQNIANLQTAGYTRQGVLLSSLGAGAGVRSAGNGVEVSALLRFADAYKSQQMWRAASDQGARSQTQPYLTQLERVMGDDASSISNGIDGFFAALNASAVDPTSTPLRQQIVTSADAMAQRFNSISTVMGNQLLSVQQQRAAIVPQVNTTLANIAALNQRISTSTAAGTNVSSLMDARDQLIDGLASQMGIEVLDQPDGSRNIALKSGQPLVIGSLAGTMSSNMTNTGEQTLSLDFAKSSYKLDPVAIGGQMGGLGEFEQNTLKPLQQSLQDMATQLTNKVNAQLALGKTMAGTPGGPLLAYANGKLSITPGFNAKDLALSLTGQAGDSGNLQKLIEIKNQPITVSWVGSVLMSDADTQLVGKLGIYSQQNQALLKTANTVRAQAIDDWKSTSGVNKDEEAMSLVEFQNMYQANMKVISVANSLFDATLQMMG
ncbi:MULTISPECIES: flagellar hook-associated protein FlgK [Janthinobacterium]|uniref:Flagellar hook-associated protein 1 n=1 Tax=Janthinobacterium lividum TaxID=29581 RepID=A0ABU0Y044_9BURK|nr:MULTISPECIES: flagellar hook-associated protein FlgK [Janthinobacterium]MBR7632507.1 flagellar hook-associated protein FlgK [Janthinobacterium lividum]MCC7698070.1 flagellar hook-associated protein FlgK [Janthinobacterium sp. EB271-G4-7A]MCC7712793.1 flagellar hook-associated protein FlgK [Janthinobacterium lividum]MDQ4629220.1 flagellar hook-associated protein FlgK [Janthinobacterium lividum]MDQ4676293.1 flagellar hook-associated protein FlgK [Janthinobacterium lividum]